MKAQPFWAVTATIGCYSDRRWWIVSVHVDREEAVVVLAALKAQANVFYNNHGTLTDYFMIWLNSYRARLREPSPAEWAVALRQIHKAYEDLKLDMLDVRFRAFDSSSTKEVPTYEIAKSYDDPRAEELQQQA